MVTQIAKNELLSESYILPSSYEEYPFGYEVIYERQASRLSEVGGDSINGHSIETVSLKAIKLPKIIDYFLSVSVQTKAGEKPKVIHRTTHKTIPGELADRLNEFPQYITKILNTK